MLAADRPDRRNSKVLAIDAGGGMRHLQRADLAKQFGPDDLVIANDAATMPASLHGTHLESGAAIEIRLAAWIDPRDFTQFVAVAFGEGDYRIATEDRAAPPLMSLGDHLILGPLEVVVDRLLDHPRLLVLRFLGDHATVLAGLARHGRPIQYAHVSAPVALGDVWTSLAAAPIAFEAPSAGFVLDWRLLETWRQRQIHLATLTHAAGISSTGDPHLDRRLPFEEPYIIPENTRALINRTKSRGRRITAIGTTVVRALEAAANADFAVEAGPGVARERIGPETRLCVVDTILTGIHQPGDSHFELLQAFVDKVVLDRAVATLINHDYRAHEFGDAMLIERKL
ncbi:MAG: S-adenosylmethionine:tRNA ribosyltransferase-isomerase [Geminicoccaceae bacterium]